MQKALTISILMLTTSLSSAGFAADETTTPLGGVYECAAIEDDTQRLACFDAAVSSLKTAEAAGQIVAVDNRQIRNLEREAFGFELPSLPKIRIPTLTRLGGLGEGNTGNKRFELADGDEADSEVLKQRDDGEVTKVGYPIARTKVMANTKIKFYLENGQIWIQIDTGRVRIPRNREVNVAEIRRAAMGSYLMRINGEGRAVRVRRTR